MARVCEEIPVICALRQCVPLHHHPLCPTWSRCQSASVTWLVIVFRSSWRRQCLCSLNHPCTLQWRIPSLRFLHKSGCWRGCGWLRMQLRCFPQPFLTAAIAASIHHLISRQLFPFVDMTSLLWLHFRELVSVRTALSMCSAKTFRAACARCGVPWLAMFLQ